MVERAGGTLDAAPRRQRPAPGRGETGRLGDLLTPGAGNRSGLVRVTELALVVDREAGVGAGLQTDAPGGETAGGSVDAGDAGSTDRFGLGHDPGNLA